MVIFSNGAMVMFFSRAPLPTMVFQWFCYSLTITIECFFADWPLTSMVFQWFYPNSGTMVSKGFGYERTENMHKCDISHFTTNLRNLHNTLHAHRITQNLKFMTWRKTLPSWVPIRIKTPFCISDPTSMAEKVPIFILTETSDKWASKIISNCALDNLSCI